MISIGVDCEEIERFHRVLKDPLLLERIFSSREIEHCLSKADPKKHLAARFCAKEAIIKALSQHHVEVEIADIEILNDGNGVPQAKVDSEGLENLVVQVSLSHCNTIAVAQAVVYSHQM